MHFELTWYKYSTKLSRQPIFFEMTEVKIKSCIITFFKLSDEILDIIHWKTSSCPYLIAQAIISVEYFFLFIFWWIVWMISEFPPAIA